MKMFNSADRSLTNPTLRQYQFTRTCGPELCSRKSVSLFRWLNFSQSTDDYICSAHWPLFCFFQSTPFVIIAQYPFDSFWYDHSICNLPSMVLVTGLREPRVILKLHEYFWQNKYLLYFFVLILSFFYFIRFFLWIWDLPITYL